MVLGRAYRGEALVAMPDKPGLIPEPTTLLSVSLVTREQWEREA